MTHPNPGPVTTTLTAVMVSHPDRPTLTLDLEYTPADPWALTLTFHLPPGIDTG
ncbi:hypothetical protein [Actinopolymorpha sp. B9G3]|uniref:hypothetical protein n=1 Tax=Actinopolymorpha sp. B9G3 TaxID=3158970 RepID=UPI0032D8DCB5